MGQNIVIVSKVRAISIVLENTKEVILIVKNLRRDQSIPLHQDSELKTLIFSLHHCHSAPSSFMRITTSEREID